MANRQSSKYLSAEKKVEEQTRLPKGGIAPAAQSNLSPTAL